MLLYVACEDSNNHTGTDEPNKISLGWLNKIWEAISGFIFYNTRKQRETLVKCSMKLDDESVAKYFNYLNNEIVDLIKSDKELPVVFKLFVEYFEKEPSSLTDADVALFHDNIKALSNNGILLVIKICRQSNSNEALAFAVVQEHFLIDKIDGVNNDRIKKIGLSPIEIHWLSEMEKKYSFFHYKLRELINQVNNMSIDFKNLRGNGNSYVSSKLNSFMDRYLEIVQNTPQLRDGYEIIKSLSKLNYPCVVDVMISILSMSSTVKNDYNAERLACLSIILEKVHNLFNKQSDPSVIFIEKLDRILDMCRDMGVFEYMDDVNVNNIVDSEVRDSVIKLKNNFKIYIRSALIIYVFNIARGRAGSDIDSYILSLRHCLNEISDYFSDFKPVMEAHIDKKVSLLLDTLMSEYILKHKKELEKAVYDSSDSDEDDE